MRKLLSSTEADVSAKTLDVLRISGAYDKIANLAEKQTPVPQLLGKLFQVCKSLHGCPQMRFLCSFSQVLTLIAKKNPDGLSAVARGAVGTMAEAPSLAATLWAFAFLVEIAHQPKTIQVCNHSHSS